LLIAGRANEPAVWWTGLVLGKGDDGLDLDAGLVAERGGETHHPLGDAGAGVGDDHALHGSCPPRGRPPRAHAAAASGAAAPPLPWRLSGRPSSSASCWGWGGRRRRMPGRPRAPPPRWVYVHEVPMTWLRSGRRSTTCTRERPCRRSKGFTWPSQTRSLRQPIS